MGVSKNRGTPKWMVYNGKPPIYHIRVKFQYLFFAMCFVFSKDLLAMTLPWWSLNQFWAILALPTLFQQRSTLAEKCLREEMKAVWEPMNPCTASEYRNYSLTRLVSHIMSSLRSCIFPARSGCSNGRLSPTHQNWILDNDSSWKAIINSTK